MEKQKASASGTQAQKDPGLDTRRCFEHSRGQSVGTSRKARNDGDEEVLAVENAAKITQLGTEENSIILEE